MRYDILFHYDHGEAELNIAISNINNTFAALQGTECSLVLVVNGPGIKNMLKDAEHAAALEDLCAKGLSLRVCNNAMNKFSLTKEDLVPGCTVVPAGILELADLQRQGYAYVKP